MEIRRKHREAVNKLYAVSECDARCIPNEDIRLEIDRVEAAAFFRMHMSRLLSAQMGYEK